MEFLQKILSLFLCLLMGITGPVISTALADGYGANPQSGNTPGGNTKGAAPCICPNCPSKSDAVKASSGSRSYFHNGSESLLEADLFIPGTFPFSIQRIYNSQSTFDSPLGYGWDLSNNERLKTYKDNSVIIRNPSGVKVSFIYTGGIYVCEENPRLHLIQNPDGTFEFYGQAGGLHHHYDQEGKLAQIQSAFGSSFRMQYSAVPMPLTGISPNSITPDTPMVVSYNHQLQRIEQWNADNTFTGRYAEFNYDETTGRLTDLTDFAGSSVSYQHDTAGNLTRVTYPEGLYKSYLYTDPNDPHNLTASAYGYGANDPVILTTREYDLDDRMITETHAGGNVAIDYTIPLQKTKVTRTTVDSNDIVLHQSDTVYEFNPEGFVTKTTDGQKSVELIRDNRNNVVEQIVWQNNGSATSPNLVKILSVTAAFDTDNHRINSSMEVGDGEKLISEFSYNNGILTEQRMYSSKTPDEIHTLSYEYNYVNSQATTLKKAQSLTSKTPSPLYNSVSFEYNSDGQQTAILFDNGDVINLEYENGLLTKKDGISFNHDNADRITSVTDRNGVTTGYEYDNAGRVVKSVTPLGQETIYTYTGWNLTQIEQGKTTENDGIKTVFNHHEYGQIAGSSINLDGSPIMQDTYSYDSDGNVLSITDQLGRTNNYSYDSWGRLTTIIDSDDNSSNAVYSHTGTLSSVTNAEGNTTSYSYDLLGRLTQTIDALGGVTSIVRNETGKVLEVTDANNRTFRFGYDLAGRKIWQDSPTDGRDSYSYDPRGRVRQIQHQDGKINTYQYNIHNQIEQIILDYGTENSTTLRYGHDKMGNLLWYSDSSIAPEALVTMSYDELNRLKSKTLIPINKTLTLDYTSLGQRQKLTLLDGSSELFSYSYAYDSGGRLTNITEQPINKTTSFTYDVTGKLIEKDYANGTSTLLTYSPAGTLSDLHHQKSDIATIDHMQYTMDKMNKITAITDSLGTNVYSYDALGRLFNVDYPGTSALTDESYTYDSIGNRLTSSTISDWLYSDDGELLSYGGTILNYDERGRQISETVSGITRTYSYDTLNRLTGTTSSGTQTSYSYDHLNRRIKNTTNNISRWYLHDGSKVVAEFDNSGQLSRNFRYRSGSFDLLSITDDGNFYTVLTGHRSSPQYLQGGDESILWHANYQAFGEAIIDSDVDNNGINILISNRFPGQNFDEITGYNENWNRSYNPATGRYTTPDPSGLTDGLNVYSYGFNDPINLSDPTGGAVVTLMVGGATLLMAGIGFLTTYDSKKDNVAEATFAASVSAMAVPIGILAAPATVFGGMLVGASIGITSTVAIHLVNNPDECLTIDELTQAILLGGAAAPLGPLFANGGKMGEELGGWLIGEAMKSGLALDSFDKKIREVNNQLYWLKDGQTKNGLTPYALIHPGKHPTEEIKKLENDLNILFQARELFRKRIERQMGELQAEAGLLQSIELGEETMIDLQHSTTNPIY